MRPGAEGWSPVHAWRIGTLAAASVVVVLCSFTARADTIQPVTAADLGASWHPGCPVDPQDLRRVEVTYRGFDGRPTAAT
jgi:hypothetical protein